MKIKCPSCGVVLAIPEAAAGKVVKCKCGKSLRAPGQPNGANQPSGAGLPAIAGASNSTKPAIRSPAAPSVDPGLFDDLSETDLQPLKQVHRPGQSTNPYQATASASQGNRGPFQGELSSLGKRFLGAVVDQLIYFLAMAIGFVPVIFLEDMASEKPSDTLVFTLLFCFGIALIIPTIINAIMITKSGQSLGKKAVGIRIVDDPTRELPGFVRAVLLRSYVTTILAQVVPFFGLIDIAFIFGEERKCLHDKMASTIVIDA